MKNAVLFLIFNRPDTASKVFEAIRNAKPTRLYVAADGPRADRPHEDKLCQITREIVKNIDWPCTLKTLFRDQNMGCKSAVAGAIDWFFLHEEQGIILEDDCLPDSTFFSYCDELLDFHRTNEKIMCISGNRFAPATMETEQADSYYFSAFNHIWGWATWRRAWLKYDVDMKEWNPNDDVVFLTKQFPNNKPLQRFWQDCFESVAKGKIDTWDYQWTHACWKNSGLTCLPRFNLVSNIGFGEQATHTSDASSKFANLPTYSLKQPLTHPTQIDQNDEADAWSGRNLFPISRFTTRRVIGRKFKNIFK